MARDAPILDADNSGEYDEAGPTVMNAIWNPIADAVVRPVFGDLTSELNRVRGLGSLSGESIVDKDLRTLLGRKVAGKFQLQYCGNGSLDACRSALWSAVEQAADGLAASQGTTDPATWRSSARRQGFTPGLISDTMRATNRPTFQQVIEFVGGGGHPGPCSRPGNPPWWANGGKGCERHHEHGSRDR